VSSIEPNRGGGQVDSAEKARGGFVISRGDAAELLELGEEVFDQMARFVEFAVMFARHAAIAAAGNDHRLAGGLQRLDHPLVGIERLVGDHRVGLQLRQQVVGTDQVVRLAAGQEESQWISQGIDSGMDLGAQPTARAADRLVLGGFFWAPALC